MAYSRAFSIILLLTTIAACSSRSNPPEFDAVAEASVIAQLEAEWSEMFGARDLDGIATLLAQNTVLIMPEAEPIVGADNVLAVTEAMFDSDDEVSWASDFAFVAPSGDMAYDYGTATTRLVDGSIVNGQYLVVWVKEDNQWKIAADMFN